jgi:hypothetical protein
VTTGTLEEVHWEVLPHPAYSPNPTSSDFHLFGPLKEALGRKDLELMMKIKCLCNDGWTSDYKLF